MFIVIYTKEEIDKYKQQTISTKEINEKLDKNIIVIDENNNAIGMEVVDMILGDEIDGRRNVTESNNVYTVDCDMIVMALGTSTNHEALKNSDIKLTENGLVYIEDTKTSIPNIYAGGDIVTGSATVILAMEAGIKAAKKIMEEV